MVVPVTGVTSCGVVSVIGAGVVPAGEYEIIESSIMNKLMVILCKSEGCSLIYVKVIISFFVKEI